MGRQKVDVCRKHTSETDMLKKRGTKKQKSGHRSRFLVVAAVLLLLLSCVVVWALYMRNSYVMQNRFGTNWVSCALEEDYANNVKSRIQVANTSTVDAYIRVRLVSYWQTPSGNIAGRASDTPVGGADVTSADFILADGWVADTANHTYYYTQLVKAGEKTPDLFAEGSSLTLITDSEGYIQVVEVLAEAIQADPAKAAEEAWDVAISEGIITKVN